MKLHLVHYLKRSIKAILVWPALALAAGPSGTGVVECVQNSIRAQVEYRNTRPIQVQKRYFELQKLCSQRRYNLCKDASLTEELRRNILHAASQLDDVKVREAFLQAFPPKRKSDLEKLNRYLSKRLEFCDPPLHHTCASDRWQLVIEDYLARDGDYPGAKYLARWTEDHIESRISGLGDFLKERKGIPEFAQNTDAYQALLKTPGLSADSISIVSEQAMKKKINDVNKSLSDALGDARLRSFHWHFERALAEEGLQLPKATRVDFKTDRLLDTFSKLQADHAGKLERAVNRAASDANAEITQAIQTRFPELMYITDMYEPGRWFNTATFSLPGYSPRLNEALASFKARRMREIPVQSNEAARDSFITLAKGVIEFSDSMKRLDAQSGGKLLRARVVDQDGAITLKVAEKIRKLKPGKSLREAIEEDFAVKLSPGQENAILQQWHAQDMLSLPLMTIDKMPDVPKNAAILGGDGIGGGAFDAWTKIRALLNHRDAIMGNSSPDELVKRVFNALVEADGNASAVIRSAPMLLKDAVEKIPSRALKETGLTQFLTSADDANAPFMKLMKLSPEKRDAFYRQVTWNVSNSSRNVKIYNNGAVSNITVGPEILRAFLGFDKASAEASEQFLKPIEERLANASHLGPYWREKYKKVAFLAVHEDHDLVKVFVAGKDVDEDFKAHFKQVLEATLRSPEHAQLQFITNP